jgi:hypothetical protein
MPGHNHGKSIKNPNVYEALRRKGYSKTKSAKISNAQVRSRRKVKKGKARRGKRR